MKYLLLILLAPVVIVANIVGGLAAFIAAGTVNGYVTVMELLEKSVDH